jgi:hypothetical protein
MVIPPEMTVSSLGKETAHVPKIPEKKFSAVAQPELPGRAIRLQRRN